MQLSSFSGDPSLSRTNSLPSRRTRTCTEHRHQTKLIKSSLVITEHDDGMNIGQAAK